MRSIIRAIVVACALATAFTVLAAPTRYVSDELIINFRSGAGNQYRIVDRLKTGTPVEVLATQDEWTQVRLRDGQTGWVRTQYLQDQPAAADRLAAVQKQLEQAQQRNSELKDTLASVRSDLDTAQARVRELTGTKDELSQKLDAARNGLELSNENKRLKKQVIDLQRQVDDLNNETQRLSDRNRQDWFLVGAGVIVAGMLLGIILTRIRWRRRSTWGDL